MRVIEKGSYLQYLPQHDGPKASMFLGVRQKRGDPWYALENNLVNRIVLGLDVLQTRDARRPVCQYPKPLMEYQQADVQKMMSLDHCLNANPMGLGKTVEAISMLRESEARSALIVTPKIILHQWANQINEWWPGKAVKVYAPEEKPKIVDDGTIWIINYEKFLTEPTLVKFKRFQWEYLICDEAHRIKNRDSKRTLAIKQLPAKHRHALTGTPILRYVDDLWSTLHFLDQAYSGNSYWNFHDYFGHVIANDWGKQIKGLTKDPARIAILNTLLSKVSVRNNSVEVTKGKTVGTVKLQMSPTQKKVFGQLRELALRELPPGMTVANGAVLTMRMRQLTSWPGLFLDGEPGPKFEYVADTCLDNPNDKFVVFSVFEQSAEALATYLRKQKIEAVTITGQNKIHGNIANKEAFIHGTAQVLIGTVGAMGQGYDELQNVCRLMIMLDRDWSPEIMEQCEDRLKRMGQKYPVSITYLECTNSFDQYVGRVNANKAADIRAALEMME